VTLSPQSASAQTWSAANYAANAHFVPALGQPVLDLLQPQPGERILDLGCGDGILTEKLVALGARVIPDPPAGGLNPDRLNPALRHGAAFAREHWPRQGVAALFADLPAVRPAEIAAALSAARQWPAAFVADTAGDGTTLYAARPGAGFQPSFGLASRARHAASGAVELELDDIDGLRRDVDTPEDLQQAAVIGLGPHTADLLRCAPRGR